MSNKYRIPITKDLIDRNLDNLQAYLQGADSGDDLWNPTIHTLRERVNDIIAEKVSSLVDIISPRIIVGLLSFVSRGLNEKSRFQPFLNPIGAFCISTYNKHYIYYRIDNNDFREITDYFI